MPAPIDVQFAGSGSDVAAIDKNGNLIIAGSATIGQYLTLLTQPQAPIQSPNGIELFTTDGKSLSVAGADGSISTYAPPSNNPTPADQGLITWSGDPFGADSATAAPNGTLLLSKVLLREPALISQLCVIIVGAAVTPTANENFLMAFNPAGTLVGQTAAGAIDTATTSANTPLFGTLTTPYQAPGPFFWVGVILRAATPATLMRGGFSSNPAFADVGNSPSGYRFAVNGTGLTGPPPSIVPASNTHTNAFALWAGAK